MSTGLALGGGGWRGLAHIGVLKVLERESIPVDLISGTSIGSLIGALWAAGWPAEEMERAALELSEVDLYEGALGPWGVLRWTLRALRGALCRGPGAPGLVKGAALDKLLHTWMKGATADELRLPYAAVAADLTTGRKVILTSQAVAERVQGCAGECQILTGVEVATSVKASSAIPGVFEPAQVGGYTLVDGGVLDNVPAHVVRKMGADFVVAVDVRKPRGHGLPLRSPLAVLEEVTDLMVGKMSDSVLAADADVVIRPSLDDPSPMGREYVERALAEGEQAAQAQLEALVLRGRGADSSKVAAPEPGVWS